MINVQENFKIDLRTYGRQFNIKLKVNNSDFNADNLNYIKPSFTTPLFKTIMHQIELDSKVFMPKDTKISGRIGVKVNEKNYKYIDLNNYYVQSCERQEDTNSYRVLAYSKMKEAMVDYDLSFAGKITVRNYLIKICERLGWNTDNIPATFINSEKMIDPNLHTGIKYSFRDALDEIATITCSFLMFKGDNFYLLYLTETNETIDESYLDEDNVTIGEKYLINSLVFSRAEESDNIYRKDNTSITANGLHEYRIADCQLLSTNDRADYIDEMFNYLKTLEFYIFDVQSKGILFLEACDLFNFKLNNTTYKVALLNDEINIDDGLTENLFLEKPEETETEYKYADSTDKKINQAYILVDKQNQRITQLTEETTENSQKITKTEQDVNGLTTKVSSVEQSVENITNTQNTATGKNIHLEDSSDDPLVSIKVKGSTTQATRSGKNKFNKEAKIIENGATKSVLDTGVRITQTHAGQYRYGGIRLGGSELLGKTLRISANWTKSADNVPYIAVYLGNSSSMVLYSLFGTGVSGQIKQTTIPNAFPAVGEQVCDTVYILLYSNRNGTGNVGDYVDYTDLIVTVDNDDMTYEDYGVSPSPDYRSPIENVEGNVEIKDIGKQIFNKNDNYVYTNAPNSITINQLNTGLRIKSSYSSGIPTVMYKSIDLRSFAGKTVKMKSKIVNSAQNKGEYALGLINSDLSSRRIIISGNVSNKEISFIIPSVDEMGDNHFLGIWLRVNGSGTMTSNAYVDFTDLMVVIGDTIGEYEDYQEQKETFPLENQKLMKGSYLASDGIHHSRKQVVFDGSDDEDWKLWGASLSNVERFYINLITPTINITNSLCSHFKFMNSNQDEQHFRWSMSQGINNQFVIFIDKSKAITVAELKTWLQSNPITIEYELSEEEIVPYTEAQQEAWDKIEQLHTYKNVTNIFSDAELDIVYVRDNGLSDMYETKQNASKNYTKTSTEIQQLDDSIKRTISQIGDRSQKTTTITEDIDGINSKVKNFQDLTQTTSGTKTIVLSNCAKGDLLSLRIKGNNTVFEYLYPSSNLYPANNLLPMGDSRISVNETVYELGITDVLRKNGEVYDEFVLENGQAKIIHRINTDGTVKAKETTEDLGKLSILLNEGKNTIKIINYSAEITAKYVIKSDYTEAFATKVEMNSSIEQTAEKIESNVSKTYQTLEDAKTQYSNIKQTTDEITTEVGKKVGENEIISKINQTAEDLTIDANRININGTVSANGNFKVDTNGNMECVNAKINVQGGENTGDSSGLNLKVTNPNDNYNYSGLAPDFFIVRNGKGNYVNSEINKFGTSLQLMDSWENYITMRAKSGSAGTSWHTSDSSTSVSSTGITTPTLTQTSKAESKKNFEKFTLEEAKEILNNTDIYKYNLKSQGDKDKKHIGFVIGDDYNYSEKITSEKNDGANIYSMTSVLYTIVQEQQKQIEELQQRVEKLEGGQDK